MAQKEGDLRYVSAGGILLVVGGLSNTAPVGFLGIGPGWPEKLHHSSPNLPLVEGLSHVARSNPELFESAGLLLAIAGIGLIAYGLRKTGPTNNRPGR